MLEIVVITVSDRAFRGEYTDLSGPRIREIITNSPVPARVDLELVADEWKELESVLRKHLDKDFILTTGGTGLSPRDITPEVTAAVCERILPGISEMLRSESLKETKYAALSRGVSGQAGRTIIINLPGSVRAVTLCTTLLLPLMEHAVEMAGGGGHQS